MRGSTVVVLLVLVGACACAALTSEAEKRGHEAHKPHLQPRFHQKLHRMKAHHRATVRGSSRQIIQSLLLMFAPCKEACLLDDGDCARTCSSLLASLSEFDKTMKGNTAPCPSNDIPDTASITEEELPNVIKNFLKTKTGNEGCLLRLNEFFKTVLVPSIENRICMGEYRQAYTYLGHFEGSLEDIAKKRLKALHPTISKEVHDSVLAEVTRDTRQAFQNFEFQRMGKRLYNWKPIQWMARSLLRRAFEAARVMFTANIPKSNPPLTLISETEDGAGFVCSPKGDVKKINEVLKRANSRVLTSIAYHLMAISIRKSDLRQLRTTVNKLGKVPENPFDLNVIDTKTMVKRCNIFGAGIVNPVTMQPPGWPWMKYFTWYRAEKFFGEALGKSSQFVLQEKNPQADTCFVPDAEMTPERSEDEKSCGETFKSGCNNYNVISRSIPRIDQNGKATKSKTALNWLKQLQDKGLVPLAGPSSTTSAMIEYIRFLKLKPEEVPLYRLLLAVWMIEARDHSWAEIAGAFDAYAYAQTKKYGVGPEADHNMGWHMRLTKSWDEAYNNLLNTDKPFTLPAIPAFKGKLQPSDPADVELDGMDAVSVDPKELHKLLTEKETEECYPSYYMSKARIQQQIDRFTKGFDEAELADGCGLLDDRPTYCAVDLSRAAVVKPFQGLKRRASQRPEQQAPAPNSVIRPYLSTAAFVAVRDFIISNPQKKQIFEQTIVLLQNAFHGDSVSERRIAEGRLNPFYEVFVTMATTNNLGVQICDLLEPAKQSSKSKPCLYRILNKLEKEKEKFVENLLEKMESQPEAAAALVTGSMLASVILYSQAGDSLINFEYGSEKPKSAEMAFTQALSQYGFDLQHKAARKKEVDALRTLINVGLASPLFPHREQMLWHGSQDPAIDQAIAAHGTKKPYQFPGFFTPGLLSTSYDINAVIGWIMMKENVLQIEPTKLGAVVDDISAAPGEREALISSELTFNVDMVCYAQIKVREDLPSIKQKQLTFMAPGPEMAKNKVAVVSKTGAKPNTIGAHDDACAEKFKTVVEKIKESNILDTKFIRLVSLSPVKGETFTKYNVEGRVYEEREPVVQQTPAPDPLINDIQNLDEDGVQPQPPPPPPGGLPPPPPPGSPPPPPGGGAPILQRRPRPQVNAN